MTMGLVTNKEKSMSNNLSSILSDPMFQGIFQQNAPPISIADELDRQKITVAEKLDSAEGSALTMLLGVADLATLGFASKTYEAIQKYNDGLEKIKLYRLLEEFQSQYSDTKQAVDQLRQLIESPEGFVLFQKLLAIQSGPTLDFDFSRQLAIALKRIADSDFKALFSRHKYVLMLLDSLSPQSLALLIDHKNWPFFEVEGEFNPTVFPNYELHQIDELKSLLDRDQSMTSAGSWEKYFAEAYFKEQNDVGDADSEIVKMSIRTAMYDLSLKYLVKGSFLSINIGGVKTIGAGKFLLSYLEASDDSSME